MCSTPGVAVALSPAALAEAVPGPEVFAALAALDLASLSADDRLFGLEAWERLAAYIAARTHEVVAVFAGAAKPSGEEPMRDELAMAMRWSRGVAQTRIDHARHLTDVLPGTLAALQAGAISARFAAEFVYATAVLPPDVAAQVESRVLPKAPEETLAGLKQRLRRAVARADTRRFEQAHAKAAQGRRVELWPGTTGWPPSPRRCPPPKPRPCSWPWTPWPASPTPRRPPKPTPPKAAGDEREAARRRRRRRRGRAGGRAGGCAGPGDRRPARGRPGRPGAGRAGPPGPAQGARPQRRRPGRHRPADPARPARHSGRAGRLRPPARPGRPRPGRRRRLDPPGPRPRHRAPARLRHHRLPPTPSPPGLRHRQRPHLPSPRLPTTRLPLRTRPPPAIPARAAPARTTSDRSASTTTSTRPTPATTPPATPTDP